MVLAAWAVSKWTTWIGVGIAALSVMLTSGIIQNKYGDILRKVTFGTVAGLFILLVVGICMLL